MVKHVGANRVLIAIWDSGAEGDRYRDQGVVELLHDKTRERLTEGRPFDAVDCRRKITAMLRAMAGWVGGQSKALCWFPALISALSRIQAFERLEIMSNFSIFQWDVEEWVCFVKLSNFEISGSGGEPS